MLAIVSRLIGPNAICSIVLNILVLTPVLVIALSMLTSVSSIITMIRPAVVFVVVRPMIVG